MFRKAITLAIFLVLLLVACNGESDEATGEDTQQNGNQEEEFPDDDAAEETNSEEEASDENRPGEDVDFSMEGDDIGEEQEDQGDANIRFGGEIKIEGEEIIVEGESNLLPDAEVRLEVEALGHNLRSYDSRERVLEDGTFEIETEVPDVNQEVSLFLSFDPSTQPEEAIENHYGENGENVAGDLLYHNTQGGRDSNTALFMTSFDPGESESKMISIEEFTWEQPEDYGDTHVRLEPELSRDDEYFYVYGESNLISGSRVSGVAGADGYVTMGYNDDYRVLPDGTFQLAIPIPEDIVDHEDFYIQLSMRPGEAGEHHIELYGEDGEHLEGDLVQSSGSETQMIRMELDLE